jgi:hypothetical protein
MAWMYGAWQGIKQGGKALASSADGSNAAAASGGEAGLLESIGNAVLQQGDGGAVGIGNAIIGGDPKKIAQQLLGGGAPEPTGEKAGALSSAKGNADMTKATGSASMDQKKEEKAMAASMNGGNKKKGALYNG